MIPASLLLCVCIPRRDACLGEIQTILFVLLTCCSIRAGIGQQTLGEEYCDILQTSSDGLEPSAQQRVSQVFMYSLLPLVQAKIASTGIMHSSPDIDNGSSYTQDSHQSNASKSLHVVDMSEGPVTVQSVQSLHAEETEWAENLDEDGAGVLHGLQSLRLCSGRTYRACTARLQGVEWQHYWIQATVRLAPLLPLLSQLHLALFYLRGVFYEAPKRLAEVRMTYCGSLNAQRQYYGAMGALLFVQLAARLYRKLWCAATGHQGLL
jgi:peroxin-10